jgi:hypothetical protein
MTATLWLMIGFGAFVYYLRHGDRWYAVLGKLLLALTAWPITLGYAIARLEDGGRNARAWEDRQWRD